MFTLEMERVYTVDPHDNSIDIRAADDVGPVDYGKLTSDFTSPFWAYGVEKHDLVVFGTVVAASNITTLGFLVVTSGSNQGYLATTESICLDPENLINPELAKKLASVSADELGQFGADMLAVRSLCQTVFPEARGFTA